MWSTCRQSDVTHRLWDWPDERNGGRELHIDAGLRAIEAGWPHNVDVSVAPSSDGVLVRTEAYSLRRATPGAGEPLLRSGDGDTVAVAIVLRGALAWSSHGDDHRLERAGTVLLPAGRALHPRAATAETQVLLAIPAN